MFADLAQLTISGLATGAMYALAAMGFTLLWQTSSTINFAQGEFVMVPAFIMLGVLGIGMPLIFALALSLAASALAALGAHPLTLNVADLASCAGLAWSLVGEAFDVAVINAGVYGPRKSVLQVPTQDEFDLGLSHGKD